MAVPPLARPVLLRAAARPGLGLLLVFAWLSLARPAAAELRGLWVDAFHPGLRQEREVRELVGQARAAGFNALFVQVRRRGDALYQSDLEPRADDVEPGFDPLRRLLELAHDPHAGPRLEVHAWVVAFNIWNSATNPPPQPGHPFRRHPEWLTRNPAGNTWDGANYGFDPGLPAVQDHTFRVVMDLVRRYDLDGLHWDYIRYAGRDWGYHPGAVARFNTLYHRTGRPARDDPGWLQFRRDQVTALVRRVWLAALAEKPALRISAATIAFAPGPASPAHWTNSAAYTEVLQDWRSWLEEGILDLAVPMLYFRQPLHGTNFAAWAGFTKAHAYHRATAIGVGTYLNQPSNALAQIRLARQPAPDGATAAGFVLYSYAEPVQGLGREAFFAALRRETGSPTEAPGPASMPWKSPAHAIAGHLLGSARDAATEQALDGVRITLDGPVRRELVADGNGWFGAIDLPPGDYAAVLDATGFDRGTADVSIRPGAVARVEFTATRTPAATTITTANPTPP